MISRLSLALPLLMPGSTMRLLLIGPRPLIRRGVERLLQDGHIDVRAGEAATGREGIALSRADEWDLVLLDRRLPDIDSLDVLKQLKLDAPRRGVLMLAGARDPEHAVRAVRAGAAGYLCEDAAAPVILDAICRAASGRAFIEDWLAELLAARMQDARPAGHRRLSDREFQVLVMLASGRAVKEIGEALSLSIKTVSTYRTRVLDKLGLHSNAELAVYALQHDLLPAPPPIRTDITDLSTAARAPRLTTFFPTRPTPQPRLVR